MESAERVRAFRAVNAMIGIGITERRAKSVLKKLLRLYDKNWELIEDENYRALADAIFEQDEEAADEKEEKLNHDSPEPPLKRLCVRNQTNQASRSSEMSSKRPRIKEENERPRIKEENEDEGATKNNEEQLDDDSSEPTLQRPRLRSQTNQALVSGLMPLKRQKIEEKADLQVARGLKSELHGHVSPQSRPRERGKEPMLSSQIGQSEETTQGPSHLNDSRLIPKEKVPESRQNNGYVKSQSDPNADLTAIKVPIMRPLHDVNDISRGEERVSISVVNEVSSEPYPPLFYYIPRNVVYQNAYVNTSLAGIGDKDCCSNCFGDCVSTSIPCACARETECEFAYTLEGQVKEKFLDECISMNRNPQHHHRQYCKDCPLKRSRAGFSEPCNGHLVRKFVKECWSKCGCNVQCGNRVVQRGITCNLQVFKTSDGKGWGLRTLEALPRGTFVCEYAGEILTIAELEERNMQTTGSEKHTNPVLLDADWGPEAVLKDEEALCLDATHYGNVARFINHRCFDANLVVIPVEVETPEHHYYRLALFTARNIDALEELTWDYGIDFDDHSNPIEVFGCRCGSECCRDTRRSRKLKSRN